MVLLTGGQVSMAISSGIVFLFTSLLFLSGYVLQQQTVRGLQEAIKPRLPKPIPPPEPTIRVIPNPNARAARPVGGRHDIKGEFQEYLAPGELRVDWAKLAYAQLVKDHVEVCSAIMTLGELHREKSPARKVLLFPKAWLVDSEETPDPYVETTRRLLRMAVRRFGVTLKPIEPVVEGADATLPSSYSLASIFTLTEFERVIYLPGPGILLDALNFDSLLAFAPSQALSVLAAEGANMMLTNSLLLIRPSAENYAVLKDLRSSHPMSDAGLFKQSFPNPRHLLPPAPLTPSDLVADSAFLRTYGEEFNATTYLDTTAYVRFADPELPGPEYDIPYRDKVDIRPKRSEPRMVWERLYEGFRQRRMDICGLDLVPWMQPVLQAVTRVEVSSIETFDKEHVQQVEGDSSDVGSGVEEDSAEQAQSDAIESGSAASKVYEEAVQQDL